MMTDALDMFPCPHCGDYYVPEETVTGRLLPHGCMKIHGVVTGRFTQERGSHIDTEV